MGADVSAEAPLMSAGLDSLGAVELRKELSTLTGMELPATLVFDYPSADSIAQLIAGQLAPQMQGAGPTLPRSEPTPGEMSEQGLCQAEPLALICCLGLRDYHVEA